MTVDQIYDVRSFLDKHFPTDQQQKTALRQLVFDMANQGPLRLVRVLLTHSDPIKRLGVNIRHPNFERRIGGEVYISNNWQTRLTHLKVEENASGVEVYAVVPASVTLEQLFPCDVHVDITTLGGSEVRFEIPNPIWETPEI